MSFRPLRKQGDTAIVATPSSTIKSCDQKNGVELQIGAYDWALVMFPSKLFKQRRYTMAQLLGGATVEAIKALHYDTALSLEGYSVGRELV